MSFRLFKLIKTLDNKGVIGVDEYIYNNKSILDNLKNNELEKFINYYLTFKFEILNKYPFEIYNYINKSTYLNQNDLINTRYFNTMSSGFSLRFLRKYHAKLDKSLVNYMICKLDRKDFEHYLKFIKFNHIEYKIPKIITKLEEFSDIELTLLAYKVLKTMNEEIMDLIFNKYTAEKLKEFTLMFKYVTEIKDIIERLIKENRIKEAVDIVIAISNRKANDESERVSDNKGNYLSFAAFCNMECRDNLAQIEDEVIKTNNYDLMYYWVISVEGPKKYDILYKMLMHEELDLGKLMISLDKKYVRYIVEKICEVDDNDKINYMIHDYISYLKNNSVYTFDLILDIILLLKPDYKLSKCACIKLLGYNTKHYNDLINSYEYTQEERNEILENISLNENYNLFAMYGAYYLTGDKSMIVNDNIIEENKQVLRLMRSTNL